MTEPTPEDSDLEPDLDADDPWAVLGVAYDATPSDIKRAYRKLVKRYRPERHPNEFQTIRSAYEWVTSHAPPSDEGGAEPSRSASIPAAETSPDDTASGHVADPGSEFSEPAPSVVDPLLRTRDHAWAAVRDRRWDDLLEIGETEIVPQLHRRPDETVHLIADLGWQTLFDAPIKLTDWFLDAVGDTEIEDEDVYVDFEQLRHARDGAVEWREARQAKTYPEPLLDFIRRHVRGIHDDRLTEDSLELWETSENEEWSWVELEETMRDDDEALVTSLDAILDRFFDYRPDENESDEARKILVEAERLVDGLRRPETVVVVLTIVSLVLLRLFATFIELGGILIAAAAFALYGFSKVSEVRGRRWPCVRDYLRTKGIRRPLPWRAMLMRLYSNDARETDRQFYPHLARCTGPLETDLELRLLTLAGYAREES